MFFYRFVTIFPIFHVKDSLHQKQCFHSPEIFWKVQTAQVNIVLCQLSGLRKVVISVSQMFVK